MDKEICFEIATFRGVYCVIPAAAAQVEKSNVNKHGLTVLSRPGGCGGQQGKYALLRLRQTSLCLEELTYFANVAIIYTSVQAILHV